MSYSESSHYELIVGGNECEKDEIILTQSWSDGIIPLLIIRSPTQNHDLAEDDVTSLEP